MVRILNTHKVNNKWLAVIVGVLAVSVLVTAGIVISLAMARQDGQADTVAEAEQEAAVAEAEQAVGLAEAGQATVTTDDATTEEPRLTFVSDQEGGGAVYVMDADGSNRYRISEPSLRVCLYPTWSPDEQRVVYWGTEEGTFHGTGVVAGVWVSAADGSEHVRVNHDASQVLILPPPIWSPDGPKVAVTLKSDLIEDLSFEIKLKDMLDSTFSSTNCQKLSIW